MVNPLLIKPQSIVVVGGSDNTNKPGGKVLENLINGGFQNLYVLNPKSEIVQGIKCHSGLDSLPDVDLAILAIPARFCYDTVVGLAKKGTDSFIILSAGFGELNDEGKDIENKLVKFANRNNISILGPNCIGIINEYYKGAFTTPIPDFNPKGVDFISSSGSTAVFVMEAGMKMGMQFSSIYSVGNAIQIQVEDILEYFDDNYIPGESSNLIMLYIEQLSNPEKLLKHSRNLIDKGCNIVAVKAGLTEAGGRAASSHTGAMASPEIVVESIFKKAGIIQCYSREEMLYAAGVLFYGKPKGKNVAIITHAGGAGVMCADALEKGGMNVPEIKGEKANELLSKLYSGSSVSNPIDFLATGTAEQLGMIIDYCNNDFDEIDEMVVIFGSPGLFDVTPVYDLLAEKIDTSAKPIYPVLPSPVNTEKAMKKFVENGKIFFPDESVLASTIAKTYNTPPLFNRKNQKITNTGKVIPAILNNAKNRYLNPEEVTAILNFANIKQVPEYIVKNEFELNTVLSNIEFPIVMKVVGPIHKTDVGGVVLNIDTIEMAKEVFERLVHIKDATSVLVQPMVSGIELFIGAKKEKGIGHIVMAGMGGIYLETIKDIVSSITPVTKEEAKYMIHSLKSIDVLKGTRGQDGINIDDFANIISGVSILLQNLPQISEMDINPLIVTKNDILVVDCRIKTGQ